MTNAEPPLVRLIATVQITKRCAQSQLHPPNNRIKPKYTTLSLCTHNKRSASVPAPPPSSLPLADFVCGSVLKLAANCGLRCVESHSSSA